MRLLEWTVDQATTMLSSPVPTVGEIMLFPSHHSDVEVANHIFQIGTPEHLEILQVDINLTFIQVCDSRNFCSIVETNPCKALWVLGKITTFWIRILKILSN
jgi:hypothetical protein